MDPVKLAELFARAEREVGERRLPSVQLAIAREGRIAGMRSFGTVTHEGRPAPATNDTLYVVFSCSQAAAVVQNEVVKKGVGLETSTFS